MENLPNIKEIARKYIAFSNAQDYNAMADLFDENADWIPISPIEPKKGREAIRERYLNHVKNINRPIINDRYYADGLTCVVEFDVQMEDDSFIAIVDIFTFNQSGQITRLSVYRK